MFRFAHPEYLYALYIIPLFIIAFWSVYRHRITLINKFAKPDLHNILFSSYSGKKSILKFGIFILVYALLAVSAANPQIGTRLEEVKQTGIDVFILLDVSLSMKAEDIKPNRLEKAKYQISNLINRLRGDRVGLVIFSGEAYVQFPLTTDYSAASLFLSAVDFNSVPQPGTAIGPAISLAVKSFDYSSNTQKAIVVITDGEENQGNPLDAVEEASAKEIKIYTIGLGSPDGVPIPISNDQFKHDGEGNVVLTKLDESVLKQIASSGNGKYFLGSNYEDHLDKIYDDLSSLEKAEFGIKKVTDYEDRFYYFLAPAILLLIIEFFISERRSRVFLKLNKKFGI